MSFLGRFFGSRSDNDQPVRWSWPRIGILPLDVKTGEFTVQVDSSSEHEKAIKESRKLHQSSNVPVYLNREPRNSGDPNAVAVMSALQQHLGYLNSDNAAQYAESLDSVAAAGLRATCIGKIVDGNDGESFGLSIDIATPDVIIPKLDIAVREIR